MAHFSSPKDSQSQLHQRQYLFVLCVVIDLILRDKDKVALYGENQRVMHLSVHWLVLPVK